MIRKTVKRTVLAGMAAAAMTGTAWAETVNLRVASFAPPIATETKLLDAVFSKIAAESNGTITYTLFPGGTLQPDPTVQLKLVEDGVADAAFVISGFQRTRQFPDDAVLALPNLITSATEGSLALTHLREQGMLRGYEDGNFMVLGSWTTAPMYLQTTFPISSVADLEGRKFQVANPVAGNTIRALGAVPVANIPVTGVSEAMSRGVVDGTIGDWLGTFAFRIVDVADTHVDGLPLSLATAFVPINKDTWNRIPEDGKQAILANSGVAFARMAGGMMDGGAGHFRGELEKIPGHTIVQLEGEALAGFTERTDAATAAWAAEHPDGEALLGALRDFLATTR